MTIKITDLMAKRVITAEPHDSVEHVRGILERNRIHAVPIVNTEFEPVGIVTTADLARQVEDTSPISQIMTEGVAVVSAYHEVGAAASIMLKNKIHHVVVVHDRKVVGIITSFDILQLVESRRFIARPQPLDPKDAWKRS